MYILEKSHLSAMADHALHIHTKAFNEGNKFACDCLPKLLNVYGVNINVEFGLMHESTYNSMHTTQ